jgi:hypothetical protein
MKCARAIHICSIALLPLLGACVGSKEIPPTEDAFQEGPEAAGDSRRGNELDEEAAVEAAEGRVSSGPPLADGVFLELEVEVTPKKRAVLRGRTNLPDGTIIMTSVTGQSTDFLGQDRTTIDNGRFLAGPFGPAGGLRDGRYSADATMTIPRVQDPKVRAIIGNAGENLVGPLVERGDLGITVSVEKEFQIGSEAGVAAQRNLRRQALTDAEEILDDLRGLVEAGRRMEALRDPNDLAGLRRCGEQMRRNQARAQSLRSSAETLPRSFGIHLAIAATSMNQCVSCLADARQSCDVAAESLADAGKAILEASR